MNLRLEPATPAKVSGLWRELQAADREELRLSTELGPDAAVRLSVRMSETAVLAAYRGRFAAVMGVRRGSTLTGGGIPWLLASDVIRENPKLFMEWSRRVVRDMADRHGRLHNHVWDGHERAKAWLGWLGFTLGEPEPWGPEGAPFRYFWMEP